MKYKIVRQPDEKNCGVACLAMICAYYGMDKMSLAVIREFAKTDQEGNSMFSLKIAAQKLYLNSEAYEAEKEDLLRKEIRFPAIVHTVVDGLYQHYMVIFEANKKNVVLGDPAIGQVTMKWEDFSEIWTGEIMEFEPTENFAENKKYRKNYKFVFSLIWKHKKHLMELFIISIIISAISMVTARFYSYLVDSVIPNNNLKLLVQLLLITLGIYIFTVAINWIKLKIIIKFNKKLDQELIINIYNRIINLPMSFFSTRTLGDISARFEDGDSVRSIITDFTLNFIVDLIYAIVATVILCINHTWQIVVLTFIMMELVLLTQYFFKNKMTEQTRKILKTSTDVYSLANASFMGTETIKSYNAESTIENKMFEKYKEYQDIAYKNQKLSQVQDELNSAIIQVINLFTLAVLGILTMQGQITVGELMYIYTLIDYISQPIGYFIDIQDELYETDASLERLDDVFRTTTEKEINKNRQNIREKIENIEFRNVSFQYGMRTPILKNISFDIKAGESVGIIGHSGCGKTTLIKLILNFYEASEGEIYINELNINQITTSSLRKKMAYVSQDDFWFQDTIFNNLTIGDKNANREFVNEVLETVQIKDYIDNKLQGLNTMLEEGASNLSTGQKQRLSIAKALITKPDVLILDESTSNLDAKTEELIIESLAHEKDKIKIVIAHRLNTLAKCNKIICIKDGMIEEAGTPQQLMENKGIYYELWNTQNQVFKNGSKNVGVN